MGWYSLYKWYKPWSKRNLSNRIYWYSEYVLKTPEQRTYEKEQRKIRSEQALNSFNMMFNMLNRNGEMDRAIKMVRNLYI